VFAESLLGAEYATVTVCPASAAADNVNTIVFPGDAGLVTEEIVTGEPLTFTTKSLEDAVAAAKLLRMSGLTLFHLLPSWTSYQT
jgi:hypothetical protein